MAYVALLRGINVGGKAKLPMGELIEIFVAAGATGVSTYIQSGNVVFSSDAPGAVVAEVTVRIAGRYGYPGKIVLRSAVEMEEATARNPFAGEPDEALHVYFLADTPSAAAVAGLDRERSAGDRFEVVGREIYLCLPNGMARTKLTNQYFDSRLKTTSTARNWKTVGKLVELCGSSQG